MLQSMRNLSKTWVFKGLMSLLVISFGIWGVGDMFRTHPGQREVARVGSEKILVQELQLHFQLSLPEARRAFGPDLTIAQAKKMGLLDQTLDRMMEESSFNQEASRLGLKLSRNDTFRRIAALPQLQDAQGKFDPRVWQELVGRSGLAEQVFIEQEKQNMIRGALYRATVANAKPPKLFIDDMYRAQGAKRVLEMVALRNDGMKDIPAPSQETLKTFYEEHEDDFAAPERRSMSVAMLNAADLGKDIVVTDDEVKNAYDTRNEDFTQVETRDLTQVIFQDEAKAKDFYESAKNAASFDSAAKAKGMTPIAMNKVDEKTVLPELYASVFSAHEGEVSAPVKTQMGWHVVKVKKIHAGGKPALADIKEDVRRMLQDERIGDAVARTVNQLDESLGAGKSLEDIADALKLRLVRFPALDASGKTAEGKAMRDLPEAKGLTILDQVVQESFGMNASEAGQVQDDRRGNYFVVRTDSVAPAHVIPFADIEGKVRAAWLAQEQMHAAAAAVQDIAKAMREGAKATSFAARPGAEVRLSKPLSLLGQTDPDVSQQTLEQVFQMKKGDVITAQGKTKQYALRLADIVPVDPAKPESSRMKVEEELSDHLPLDLLNLYASHLHDKFPQRIKRSVLDSLKAEEEDR